MADETLHARLLAELDRIDPYRLTRLGKTLSAVVKLHAQVPFMDEMVCHACPALVVDMIDDAGVWTEHRRPASHPCDEIKLIARELGITEEVNA